MKSIDYSSIAPVKDYIEPFKRKSKLHYGFHAYFTTQPYNVVSTYINNFSSKGDIVCDPFVGSGVTAVESLRNTRKSIVVDINPFAVFLTKVKCSYVDIDKTIKNYQRVLNKVKKECEEIENISEREAKTLNIPYKYPASVKLPSNADANYLHDIFTKKQLYQLALIKTEIDSLPQSNEKDLLLILFCGTLSRANIAYSLPDDGRSIYSGDFTIFHTGRYRIPKKIVKIPVLPVFERRFTDLLQAKMESNGSYGNFVSPDTFQAHVGSATELKKIIKDSSVDYIYSDPPYGGHIAYLDLSIVYNSWLGFKVTKEMLNDEVIEGGEVKHTMNEYKRLLQKSISEMSRILKADHWLSLVYQYREPSLWTNIVETAKSVGLEYKNSVVQPTKLPSWHKIDVPQSVLSSQMIINFVRKKGVLFSISSQHITLNQLVLNVAEREIVKRNGATFEEIINALVPELFEHNYIHEEAQTKTDKIFKFLSEEFSYDSITKIFTIDGEKVKKLGNYIPMQDRVKFYLISYMRLNKKATLEDILPSILPKLINGEAPSGEQILDELKKIAHFDGKFWIFSTGEYQTSMDFERIKEKSYDYSKGEIKLPDISNHNKIIYMLSLLANKYKLIPKVGNEEQKEPFLKAISQIELIDLKNVTEKQKRNINNIDCLWLTQALYPIFAFEIEHTTQITTALERFISLLKYHDDVAFKRRLILVISQKNRRKFDSVIRESSYIGAPHYINNKIKYMFEEQFIDVFEGLMNEKDFTKFEGLLSEPQLG